MKKGFTLIEVLAVIIILGVIVMIVVPSIGNSLNKSEDKTIIAAVEMYIKGVNDLYTNNILEPTNPVKVGSNSVSSLESFMDIKNPPTAGYVIVSADDDKVSEAELCIKNTYTYYKNGKTTIDYDRGCDGI